jgi:transketolase N-terminal domain/subunit
MDVVQIAELLGNVGEFLGSILVLVTLIYLALQVKQSKELLEKQDRIALSQVHQARTELRINHSQQIINSGFNLTLYKLEAV